ncbi:MAG TPA: lytic transglycosylase domain-containing protein, partial [Polyangiaceae bacterium]|nr:lytic transglycosylase domain-containing protein [Polyangiaceae bacterium]
ERWQPVLAAAAERHGVDPTLLAIVTLVESLGDPSAHSPAGAVGLMQVMPTTAASIAAERALDDYSEERLWDPDYNVDFGAWYLSRQLAEFGPEGISDRSVSLAAIAYNGGPGLARASGQGAAALPDDVRRYRDLVVGMWRERALAESPTFAAWKERLRQLMAAPESWQTLEP